MITFSSTSHLTSPPTRRRVWFVGLVGALTLSWAGPTSAELRVIPHDAPFAGQSLVQWAEDWWRWYYEIPGPINPKTDRSGRHSAQAQDETGAVWFLASTFDSTFLPVRHIQVPPGRALLIPVVEQSWLSSLPEDPTDERGILRFLPPFAPADLVVTLDGATYPSALAHQLQSGVFDDVAVGAGHPSGAPAGVHGPGLGQGVFLLLEPPDIGRHQIRFAGRLRPSDLLHEVVYELEVLPGPPVLTLRSTGDPWQIRWPTNAAGYIPERIARLDTPPWQPFSEPPVLEDGSWIQTAPAGEGAQFFRLRREAQATLRLSDPFAAGSPNDDSLVGNAGGTGFVLPWRPGGFNATQSANYRVESESLTYPGLLLSEGRVRTASSTAITGVTRPFPATLGGAGGPPVLFLSFLARPEGTLGGGAFNGFFGLYLSGGSDVFVGRGGDGVSTDWIVEERGGLFQSRTGRPLKLNETALLVVKFDLRPPRRGFVYVNPPPAGNEPLIPDVVHTRLPASFSRLTLYSTGAHSLDEIRIGDTFASVTPSAQ